MKVNRFTLPILWLRGLFDPSKRLIIGSDMSKIRNQDKAWREIVRCEYGMDPREFSRKPPRQARCLPVRVAITGTGREVQLFALGKAQRILEARTALQADLNLPNPDAGYRIGTEHPDGNDVLWLYTPEELLAIRTSQNG